MEISDRSDDWPDAGLLRDAMHAVGAVLVVSLGHPWDAYRSADEATRDRVIRAVNAFPRKAMATGHPHEAERAELDRAHRGEVDASATGQTDVRLNEFDDLHVVLSSKPDLIPTISRTAGSSMNTRRSEAT
jgi:hypothetical protein